MGLVLRHTREGWPQEVPDLLKSYFQRRQEISVDQGCLFLGSCAIIPTGYQEQVLRELHVGHQGIVKRKVKLDHMFGGLVLMNRLRILFAVVSPVNLLGIGHQPCHCTLGPWPVTPWERVHIDFAGPLMGSMFFVLVDSHSKWLEVEPMESTTAEKTIEV